MTWEEVFAMVEELEGLAERLEAYTRQSPQGSSHNWLAYDMRIGAGALRKDYDGHLATQGWHP